MEDNKDKIVEKLSEMCRLQAELLTVMKAISGRLATEKGGVTASWMRANEVMEILGISARSLYTYTQEGAFETRRMGRTLFYTRESVMRMR